MAAIGPANCTEDTAIQVLRIYVQSTLPSACANEVQQELAHLSSFDPEKQVPRIRCGG